jgi:hypothetical protein
MDPVAVGDLDIKLALASDDTDGQELRFDQVGELGVQKHDHRLLGRATDPQLTDSASDGLAAVKACPDGGTRRETPSPRECRY